VAGRGKTQSGTDQRTVGRAVNRWRQPRGDLPMDLAGKTPKRPGDQRALHAPQARASTPQKRQL